MSKYINLEGLQQNVTEITYKITRVTKFIAQIIARKKMFKNVLNTLHVSLYIIYYCIRASVQSISYIYSILHILLESHVCL